jgi:hypothetical protein
MAGGARGSPWYAGGLQFQCRACGHCCGGAPGYIWIAPAEVRWAAQFLGLDVLDFCAMYLVEYDRGFSLRELEGGDCCLLRHGRCLIYPVRPTQCRTWPFWPSNLSSRAAWRAVAERCPGIGRGRRWTLDEIVAARDKMTV